MIDQFAIGLLGVTAVFLSQDHRHGVRRYSCLFGLCAQPFWFYATWKAQQWGIFSLCFLYAFSWARGLKQYWLSPKEQP